MAGPSSLPQYYGQQLQDGTIMESPTMSRHNDSSESRKQLLQLPMQPHQAHTEPYVAPASPAFPRSSTDAGPASPANPKRIRNYSDPNAYVPRQSNENKKEAIRLPWLYWMNSNSKNHFVAFVGEFVGTTMFLLFAFAGTQVANTSAAAGSGGPGPVVLLYVSLVFGFSLMVNVWIFFRISGGLFNPAVTFAMLLCRAISVVRAVLLFVAQIAGSVFSSFLVSVVFPTDLDVRTTLTEGTSLPRGVVIEALLTAELVFTIFMLAKEKHKATFMAPIGIGIALFVAELVGVYYTGGSLNPARSFGPCVINGVWDSEHWIYWVGPGIGAIIAVVFYKFIKMLEYEVANPGQDDDDREGQVKNAVKEVIREKVGLEGNGMNRV